MIIVMHTLGMSRTADFEVRLNRGRTKLFDFLVRQFGAKQFGSVFGAELFGSAPNRTELRTEKSV